MTFNFLSKRQVDRTSQKVRTYIIPTRAGYSYALLIVLMLLGAINYNNSLGHLLSFLLIGLGHVSMVHSYRNLQGLQLIVGQAAPTFNGQHIQLPISVQNQNTRAVYALQLGYASAATKRHRFFKIFTPDAFSIDLPILDADEKQHCSLPIPTTQRGWQTTAPIRLSSVFPLGLFLTWRFIDNPQQVLVYPKPEGTKLLPLSRHSDAQHAQGLTQKGQDDFAGFQTYREGDAKHQIAWKAFARDAVMRSKTFSDPIAQQCQFNWQDVADIPDIEAKLSQLCQWVLQAESAGQAYGLALPDQIIAAGMGDTHLQQCLTALAVYGKT